MASDLAPAASKASVDTCVAIKAPPKAPPTSGGLHTGGYTIVTFTIRPGNGVAASKQGNESHPPTTRLRCRPRTPHVIALTAQRRRRSTSRRLDAAQGLLAMPRSWASMVRVERAARRRTLVNTHQGAASGSPGFDGVRVTARTPKRRRPARRAAARAVAAAPPGGGAAAEAPPPAAPAEPDSEPMQHSGMSGSSSSSDSESDGEGSKDDAGGSASSDTTFTAYASAEEGDGAQAAAAPTSSLPKPTRAQCAAAAVLANVTAFDATSQPRFEAYLAQTVPPKDARCWFHPQQEAVVHCAECCYPSAGFLCSNCNDERHTASVWHTVHSINKARGVYEPHPLPPLELPLPAAWQRPRCCTCAAETMHKRTFQCFSKRKSLRAHGAAYV